MDWYAVDRRLAPHFRSTPRQAGAGFWISADEPVPLAPYLDEALEDGDEREEYQGSFEAWPGNVDAVLEHTAASIDGVLTCHWWSGPGWSSSDGLQLIGTDERQYLCFWCDWGEGHRVIACLQPGNDPEVEADLLEEVLLSNGHSFGVGLWGSPPSEFWCAAPDEVLGRAFEAMRERDEYGEWDEYVASGEWRTEVRS